MAAQIARCDRRAGQQLLDAYSDTEPDGPSLAVVGLSAGAISANDYDGLVKDWFSRLEKKTAKVLDPYTAVPFLQWAAGRCIRALTLTCLRDASQRLTPPGWSLDAAAELSLGDLLAAPLPKLPEDAARQVLRSLTARGLPIRADIVAAVDGPERQRLHAERQTFLQLTFGSQEEL